MVMPLAALKLVIKETKRLLLEHVVHMVMPLAALKLDDKTAVEGSFSRGCAHGNAACGIETRPIPIKELIRDGGCAHGNAACGIETPETNCTIDILKLCTW